MVVPSLQRSPSLHRPRWRAWLAGALTTAMVGLSALPALAGDPFRPNNPHAIGDATEATFRALFYEGNYPSAQRLAQQAMAAEPQEPMNYAIAAALSYLNQDLGALLQRAQQTQAAAAALKETDPLRGHLYTAVGLFMEGAHVIQTQGLTRGTPTVLRMLQQVFRELSAAEAISPNDPELSLLKGFMDLLLAVNLPFANPDQAISRLQQGHPDYLSQRGMAIGLRDLQRYDEALGAVNRALAAAPHNPDLLYLKAQILFLKQDHRASLPYYAAALEQANQLPASTVRQIRFEECQAQGHDTNTCQTRAGLN
ncbi:MAG: Sll0314/Alr1548 family TPR repeat-containing protein [Leptolyngbya sp.]|nr:Sll0314/Alr1548 family TPR repeat-containing protein [Leptolyngbya sp.]